MFFLRVLSTHVDCVRHQGQQRAVFERKRNGAHYLLPRFWEIR
jgi:hypothetical protein